MKILLILVVVVLAVVIFRFLRGSAKPAGKSTGASKRVTSTRTVTQSVNAYHSVSVKCGPDACEPALAMGEKRFLSAGMTSFPLADCTSANCQCKFVHHDDRRDAEGENRAPTTLRSELYTASGNPERRSQGGRRKSDME